MRQYLVKNTSWHLSTFVSVRAGRPALTGGCILIVAAVALLAGACIAAALPELPPDPFPAAILGGGAILVIVRRVAALGCLAIGFGLLSLSANAELSGQLSSDRENVDHVIEGVVVSIPAQENGRIRFVFRPQRHSPEDVIPALIRLTWYKPESMPRAGERWRLTVRLRRPISGSNPGGFDYERWLLAQRVGGIGYVRSSDGNRRMEAAGAAGISRLRSSLALRISEASTADEFQGFVQALILGIRSDLSPQQVEILRRTGTGHLLAISGLHIGIAAAFGLACGHIAWLILITACPSARLRRRSLALAFGLVSATTYAVLAGFSLPTRRALIMLITTFGLAWLGRSGCLPRALAAGLIAVLVLDPLAPLTPGFWLSFVAVASLTLFFTGRVVPVSPGRSLVTSQMAVWIGLAIPTSVIFGGLPLSASAINLVLIPLFSIVLVPLLLVATVLLYPATNLAGFLLDLAAMMLGWLWPALETLSRLPAAYATIAQAPLPVLGIAILGTLLALMPGMTSSRTLLPLLILPALAWDGWRPPAGAFELAVLDVGHGLAAVVRTRSRTLVFDAGPKWFGGGDAGSRIVAPYLAARGVREIDTLVISHADSDHRGGFDGLVRLIPAKRLLAREMMAHENRWDCVAGDHWEWEGVYFRILSPVIDSTLRGNNASCVLRVENDYGSVLLAGDIERPGETALVRGGSPLHATMLIAPHHGSRTSSSAAFVEAVRPKWVVFAAPRRSRWGFPDSAVVARWRSSGARTWTTGLSGAVVAKFGAHGAPKHPVGWRCHARRFWRFRACEPLATDSISGDD